MTYAATLVAVLSLLIRKRAWRVLGENGANFAVLNFGLGTYLISEQCKLGEHLWRATGYGYLDTFAGHLLWLGAIVALLHQALYRLAERDEQIEIFDALVRWPITLLVPLMLSAMYMSGAMRLQPTVDITLMPTDASDLWMHVYLMLWRGGLVYLTLLLVRVLYAVRRTGGDGPHVVVDLYLAACWTLVGSIALRLASSWEPLAQARDWAITGRCVVAILVAVAAAVSWLGKMRGYRGLLRVTRTSRRQRRADTLESHRQRVRPLDDAQSGEGCSHAN